MWGTLLGQGARAATHTLRPVATAAAAAASVATVAAASFYGLGGSAQSTGRYSHMREASTSALHTSISGVQFLQRVKVKPYSVLGTQLAGGKMQNVVGPPTDEQALVDPAGLPYISGQRPPGKAGAASGAIYKFWLGIHEDPAFPSAVSAAITQPCDAKYHEYGEGKHVIHTVGPDFRQEKLDDKAALEKLATAYENVLREAASNHTKFSTLRMLPISGGVFAAEFEPDMHHMTMHAIALGYNRLSAVERSMLESLDFELCIFVDSQLGSFERAHAWASSASGCS